MTHENRPAGHRNDGYRRSIILLALAAFGSAATTRITDAILPQLSQEFAVSVGEVSLVATGYSLTYGFFQVIFGPVGDRYGKFRVIFLACIASMLACALCGFATSLPFLAAARLLSGLTAAAIVPLSIAWIGDVIAYERRQSVLAAFISGQITGILAGQIAGGIVGGYFGWRSVFFALTAIYIVVSAGLLLEMVAIPARRTGLGRGRPFVASLGATFGLLKRPQVQCLLAAVASEGFCIFGALTYVGADLSMRFGLSFAAVGLFLSAYALGGLVYAVLASRLLGWLGQARLAVSGAMLVALAFVVIAAAPVAWVSFAAIGVLGLGFYMMHNTLQTIATQVVPEARGAAVSLFATCFFMAQAVGVFAGGAIIDRLGGAVLFAIAAACVVVLGAAVRVWLGRSWS